MDLILRYIDPGTLVGLFVVLLFSVCAVLIYRMRDPIPFPRHVSRRLWCPHKGRKFTVELNATGTVWYCSAFDYGKLPCDQGCTRHGTEAVDLPVTRRRQRRRREPNLPRATEPCVHVARGDAG